MTLVASIVNAVVVDIMDELRREVENDVGMRLLDGLRYKDLEEVFRHDDGGW